jgi:hypothetical protein
MESHISRPVKLAIGVPFDQASVGESQTQQPQQQRRGETKRGQSPVASTAVGLLFPAYRQERENPEILATTGEALQWGLGGMVL